MSFLSCARLGHLGFRLHLDGIQHLDKPVKKGSGFNVHQSSEVEDDGRGIDILHLLEENDT